VRALSDPSYTGPGAESWREVTATAIDPLTVNLQLATPLGGFLVAATQPIAPAHLLSGIAPADLPNDPFGQHPVGSGPFELAHLDATSAVLDAASAAGAPAGADGGPNATAPGPTDSLRTPPPTTPVGPVPYLSGITFRYFDDVPSLRAAWDGGELDAASGLAPADTMALGVTPGARILSYPSSTLLAVDLNLRGLTSAFRDARVRKALLQAIDRDGIVANILDGLGSRADSLVPPTSPLFDAKTSTPVAFSVNAARATLTEAGWKLAAGGWVPKGAKAPLALQVVSPESTANPVAYDVAAAIVESWRSIGLDATQVVLPPAQPLADALASGSYAAAVVPLAIGLDPDLYPLLASSQTRTGGANISGLQDPKLDKLLAAARAPNTDAGRLAAYAQLQQSLNASLYILPIAFRDEDVVLRDTVVGPTTRPVGTSGDRFWDVLTWRLADGR
jgi:ABC-type transport system substrate-binding protein